MIKLYKDINTINLEYLLEATPFSVVSGKTFSNKLTEKIFFDHIFVPSSTKSLSQQERGKINNFENGMKAVIREFGNEHDRVTLIHLKGYGGCGKTTYVHDLLRNLRNDYPFKSVCIDYEKAACAEQPLEIVLKEMLLKNDIQKKYEYLFLIGNQDLFIMDQFLNVTNSLVYLSNEMRRIYLNKRTITKDELEVILLTIKNLYKKNPDKYLYFLIIVVFLILIYDRFTGKRLMNRPMFLVVDNIDSMEPLSEEMRLVPEISEFIDRCTMFVAENLKCERKFNNFTVKKMFEKSKFVFIITTRVITARRYSALLRRGDEERNEWNEFEFPKNYYNHKEIIAAKIKFYESIESEKPQQLKNLIKTKEIADIVYSNPMYSKLFNSNIRYCFSMLRYITTNEGLQNMIEVCQKMDIHAENEGISGIILNIILRCFKSEGIFEEKLHLSECNRDGIISCSRIIITLLRENGGYASLIDLLDRLTPMFSSNEVCRTIMDLSEEGRKVWRRLITFDKVFPPSLDEFKMQASLYDSGIRDGSKFSTIVLCDAGSAYLDYVIPHFEFMLSRHDKNDVDIVTSKNQPLFMCDDIFNKVTNKNGDEIYKFEKTISMVYEDVFDCSYNDAIFAGKVDEFKNISLLNFRNSQYNYRTISKGVPGERQSYASRLVFRHVGYIEKFRHYILKKYNYLESKIKADVNKHIISWIEKYLSIYDQLGKYFQSDDQDEAAILLLDKISIIKKNEFMDFETKIELD